MKPLPEVAREINAQATSLGSLSYTCVNFNDLREWSAAITDYLAQLEALAKEFIGASAWESTLSYDERAVWGLAHDKLRALLSPAGVAVSATAEQYVLPSGRRLGASKDLHSLVQEFLAADSDGDAARAAHAVAALRNYMQRRSAP